MLGKFPHHENGETADDGEEEWATMNDETRGNVQTDENPTDPELNQIKDGERIARKHIPHSERNCMQIGSN